LATRAPKAYLPTLPVVRRPNEGSTMRRVKRSVAEELEPLVHRDLGLVGFHLAEIRIDGRVEDDVVAEDELGVEPAGRIEGLPGDDAIGKGRGIEKPRLVGEDVRGELEVPSGGDLLEPGSQRLLAEPSANLRRNAGPVGPFVHAGDPAQQHDSPRFGVLAEESQALEGDRHQDDVPLRRGLPPGLPRRIPRPLRVVVLLAP
jgi:hypothetical protein